jgi:hypothetical protein
MLQGLCEKLAHSCVACSTITWLAQEGDGISPTAIREIMLLRETDHENIVHLDSVHLNRAVRHVYNIIL